MHCHLHSPPVLDLTVHRLCVELRRRKGHNAWNIQTLLQCAQSCRVVMHHSEDYCFGWNHWGSHPPTHTHTHRPPPPIVRHFSGTQRLDWISWRSNIQLTGLQLQLLSWSTIPQDNWPLAVTSSVAYSCFKKGSPGTGLAGDRLLDIPLWHSAEFTKSIRSRVREMRVRSFTCPKLLCKMRTVRDFTTSEGQIRVDLIRVLPKTMRAL